MLEQVIADHPFGEEISILVVDFDRLKSINDSYGYQAGDHVLVTVVDRLRRLIEPAGCVARLAGDEFGCFLRHGPNASVAVTMAKEMLSTIAKPIDVGGASVIVNGFIGIASAPSGALSPDRLLISAHFAMNWTKRRGYGFSVYEPGMDAEFRERTALEADMHHGIARGEFVPFYQPIVDLRSGEVIGFECLARWNHPTRGMVLPDEFIPVAESSGLIRTLSLALLERACRDAREWPAHLTLSFNISPIELDEPWLPEQIIQILTGAGIAPGRLILEITESRVVCDFGAARHILQSLSHAGVQIALDDFGTGYANMKQLQELRFSRIKIDRNFVQNLQADGNGHIVRAILNLGHGLGLPVTAEGIETLGNAEELASLGCDFGQGYLYSPPVDAQAALLITESITAPESVARIGSRLDTLAASALTLGTFPDARNNVRVTAIR